MEVPVPVEERLRSEESDVRGVQGEVAPGDGHPDEGLVESEAEVESGVLRVGKGHGDEVYGHCTVCSVQSVQYSPDGSGCGGGRIGGGRIFAGTGVVHVPAGRNRLDGYDPPFRLPPTRRECPTTSTGVCSPRPPSVPFTVVDGGVSLLVSRDPTQGSTGEVGHTYRPLSGNYF